MHSNAGRLLERLLELEFDTEHFSVPWSDVMPEEVRGVQVPKEEPGALPPGASQEATESFPKPGMNPTMRRLRHSGRDGDRSDGPVFERCSEHGHRRRVPQVVWSHLRSTLNLAIVGFQNLQMKTVKVAPTKQRLMIPARRVVG